MLAFVLAEPARHTHFITEPVILQKRFDGGKVLPVPASEARTPQADNEFAEIIVRRHGVTPAVPQAGFRSAAPVKG
jgi:hypothetical protein